MHEIPASKTAREASADASASSEPTLAGLVRRIAQQDEAALGALYEATVERLFALARAIIRNVADAEEIVIDTYTQIWQTAGKYDPTRGTVMGWVITICRSRALDRLRHQRMRERNSCVELESNNLDGAPNCGPEALLEQLEQNSAVYQALTSLTIVQRQVLALAFFQGLSHQEITELTGLPLGTVKSHIRRALAALRTELYVSEEALAQTESGDAPTSG